MRIPRVVFRVAGPMAALAIGAGLLMVVASPSAGANTSSPAVSAAAVSAAALRSSAPVHSSAFSANGWNSLWGGGDDFPGVACSSANNCYFAGQSGTTGVIWSGNGQAGTLASNDFVKQLSVPNAWFDYVRCVGSSTDCVAVGGYGSANPEAGIVYYTSDGLNWHAGSLPNGTPELGWDDCVPNGPANPNVPSGYCWATGIDGSGWRSLDGGQTWTSMPVVTKLNGATVINQNMDFISTTQGWMAGVVLCPGTTNACKGVVSHTTDGGTTWSLLNTPANMGWLNSISCPTTTECLAVGQIGIGNGYAAAAYMTFSGGASWSSTSLPSGLLWGNDVTCPDSQHCYIVGRSGTNSNPSGAVIYATTNAGRSWTVQPVAGPTTGLWAISCVTVSQCYAAGTSRLAAAIAVTTNGGVPTQGYRFVASDGGVFSFNAPFYGSTGGVHLVKPVVGMATNSITGGYWLVASDGGVFSFNAPFYGSTGGVHLTQPIAGMAATTDGLGYYLYAADGGIFSYGDAKFQGSTGGVHLVKPIVGMALDRQTGGYWLVASDGGVFAFNAPFQGSTGGVALHKPIVAMAVDPATGGYWLVASDGGVFAFNAPFYGSTGGVALHKPIVGIQPTPDGLGYWLVASDGGIFAYGDAHFYGSTGGVNLTQPIVGMAPRA
jgi:hypothetical protein